MRPTTTTILFTDVVDSTATLASAGDGEGVRLLNVVLAQQSSIVADAGGRVVKTLGDGIMAEFASAAEAAAAAIALHRRAARDAGSPAPGLRVGIHTGDVLHDGDGTDPLGLPVVVARRLCDAAEAGQILMSALSANVAGTLLDVDTTVIGPLDLKGVPGAVPAVRLEWVPDPVDRPITVVVAEDVALVRAGLVALLREEGFDVVAEASDRDGLLAAARRLRPQLVITDVRMPPGQSDEGIVAAATLRSEQSSVAVLVLSQHVEPGAAALLLANNPTAVGYLLKERVSDIDDFIEACRTVALGGVVIDPLVTERLLRGGDRAVGRLSEREREVLDLMAQGRSNAAIARELRCSDKTLESHIRSIFLKLDLLEDPDGNRRVAAVVRYLHQHR